VVHRFRAVLRRRGEFCNILSFGHLPLYAPTAPSHITQFTCPGAAAVLLLVRCLSCLNSITDCSSCCHDSDLPLGTKGSAQGRTWWHRGNTVASVTFLSLQLLPLTLLFPSNSACRSDACVLWGCLHLCFQCQICAFTHRSFLCLSVIRPMTVLLSSSQRLDEGKEEQAVF